MFDKETRLRQFLNTAFGGSAPDKIDNFTTESATFRGAVTGGKAVPISEWAELSHVVRGLIGPTRFAVENKIEQGDWISLRIHLSADCLLTDKRIEGYDCLLARFEGDRIAEYIGHMDYLSLFEELELIPAGALHACLTGQKLIWE